LEKHPKIDTDTVSPHTQCATNGYICNNHVNLMDLMFFDNTLFPVRTRPQYLIVKHILQLPPPPNPN